MDCGEEERVVRKVEEEEEEEEEEVICLDASFFINDDYRLTKFTFGSQVLELYCLQSASSEIILEDWSGCHCDIGAKSVEVLLLRLGDFTARSFILRNAWFRPSFWMCSSLFTAGEEADFDLTGQLVWPGATLLNEYLSNNADILKGCSVIELGSGVGVTGILCARFCHVVVLTDHNDEVLKILKKNIELQLSLGNSMSCASSGLAAEKLDWGNAGHVSGILKSYPDGFDLILGADICFQQASIPSLFQTVKQLLQVRGKGKCKFILGYMSRAKMMDIMVVNEAKLQGLNITEVHGTRAVVGNLRGVIYEVTPL